MRILYEYEQDTMVVKCCGPDSALNEGELTTQERRVQNGRPTDGEPKLLGL